MGIKKRLYAAYDGLRYIESCADYYKTPFELGYLLAVCDTLKSSPTVNTAAKMKKVLKHMSDISDHSRHFDRLTAQAQRMLDTYVSELDYEINHEESQVHKLIQTLSSEIAALDVQDVDSITSVIQEIPISKEQDGDLRLAIRKAISNLAESGSVDVDTLFKLQKKFKTQSFEIHFAEEVLSSLLKQDISILDTDGDGRLSLADMAFQKTNKDKKTKVVPISDAQINTARLQMAVVRAVRVFDTFNTGRRYADELFFDKDEDVPEDIKKAYQYNGTFKDDYDQERVMYWRQNFNPIFWDGEKLHATVKEGVRPSDAIEDILLHPEGYQYECATAIVVVYYGALLQYLGRERFDEEFKELRIGLWDMMPALSERHQITAESPSIPGEWGYYKNHDVNEFGYANGFMGLNIIYLGKNSVGENIYYGLDTGTATEQTIQTLLNSQRNEDSKVDASLIKRKAQIIPAPK